MLIAVTSPSVADSGCSARRDRYPFFKAEDDRWKNSVRHNLSMNPHFRKGDKSKHGAGHLWVMADYDGDQEAGAKSSEFRQVAAPATVTFLFSLLGDITSLLLSEEDEAARAVRSILGQEAANHAAEQAAAAAAAAANEGASQRTESSVSSPIQAQQQQQQQPPQPPQQPPQKTTRLTARQRSLAAAAAATAAAAGGDGGSSGQADKENRVRTEAQQVLAGQARLPMNHGD